MGKHIDPAVAASQYYAGCGLLARTLARWRPRICPFGPLLEWVEPGSSVLDVGCGTGVWLLTLANTERMADGTGCDISSRALIIGARAFDEYRKSGGKAQVTFLQTPSMADWPKGPFDVVSLIDVLHHVRPEEQEQYLLRALSLVRRGGRLIYKDMASSPWWAAWGNRLHDLILARQWIWYFPSENVHDAVRKAGASVRHAECWRVWFYAHELLIVDR